MDHFEEKTHLTLKKREKTIVLFYHTACKNSMKILPHFRKVKETYPNYINFLELPLDNNLEFVKKARNSNLNLTHVPCICVFDNCNFIYKMYVDVNNLEINITECVKRLNKKF